MTFDKKQKKIIVASESPHLYTTKRLLAEAQTLGYQNSWLNPYKYFLTNTEVLLDLSNHEDIYFHRTTGIRYDDFDLMVSKYFSQSGFKISNPLLGIENFRDKDKQAFFFSANQITNIPSIMFRGPLTEEQWQKVLELSSVQKYILKMSRGNQGIGVNLINGAQSLKSLLETFLALKDQKFLIQPYLEHTREWRYFIIKNEIHAIIERSISHDDFRGNSKRSSGQWIKKSPADLIESVQKVARLSGLDYCGIDILEHNHQMYFIELNSIPGFEQIEELTKINIARELITKI